MMPVLALRGGCIALALQLCALQGALAAARLVEPPPAVLVEARLVALASPVDLTVASADATWQFSVRGVRDDPVCQPERHLAWARRVLPVGTRLQLGGADPWGARSVRFAWNGRVLDWAFVLLRAGQAFPGGAPGESARLPESYAWAAREARAEGRGIWGECGRALQRFRPLAVRRGIPAEVLYGVAMAESALSGAPWPWTLNVAGRPLRFPSRRDAWAALRAIERTGEQRLDIGLMQVNWHYHAGRFASLWEALDPDVNQEVAADILCEEWRRSGSLALAIARYHSARPDAGRLYLQRVSAFAKSSPAGLSLTAHPSVAGAPGCGP